MSKLMQPMYVKNANTVHSPGRPVRHLVIGSGGNGGAVVPEEECDPFLMCNEIGPTPSKGSYGDDTDEGFEVPWHPHHGVNILSYMVEGKGRHADSLGNRETFDSPGFQWLSVGSGIEHAEGGGTPKVRCSIPFKYGYVCQLQIWRMIPDMA